RALAASIDTSIDAGDGEALARALASSPSAPIYRHVWRALPAAAERPREGGVGPVLFALPVIVVAASDDADEHLVDAIVVDPAALASILVEHGALGGNRQFALAGALCNAEAIDVASLPALLGPRDADARLDLA